MLRDDEKHGFLAWVQRGGLDDPAVSEWLLKGCGYRSSLDAYEHFVLMRREL